MARGQRLAFAARAREAASRLQTGATGSLLAVTALLLWSSVATLGQAQAQAPAPAQVPGSGEAPEPARGNPYAHLFLPGVTGKELIGQVFTRPVAVIDGNRLILGGVPFWLEGVDAPERSQTCLDRERKRYPCGERSKAELEKLIAGREVTCAVVDQNKIQGATALCRVGEEEELGLQMVRSGWAFGFGQPGLRYLEDQKQARKSRKGLWKGEFQNPQLWRRGYGLQPKTFSGQSLCLIKGNIEEDGTKRYYRPGDPGYDRAVIEFDQRERFFCNMDETWAAGWRQPAPLCTIKGKVMPDGRKQMFFLRDEGYDRIKINYKNGDRWFCGTGEGVDRGFQRCLIKGVSRPNGTKQYFQEGHRQYRLIKLDAAAGDRYFCFIQDAERAGYRLAPP